ncbi:TonB-dependent receptor [Luteimonas sp. RD2P54]|uniref:TonB-dependent receptor n=1 Tax=Luteimonas endophytica TaxID=3042023 RepID=A0ABT6J7A4_9GAMM|nr:TonB-dependent receptor [Luteimonas endophytica]MDH5822706.1 TonB-dependent receptor [Luteimonas endophytica]
MLNGRRAVVLGGVVGWRCRKEIPSPAKDERTGSVSLCLRDLGQTPRVRRGTRSPPDHPERSLAHSVLAAALLSLLPLSIAVAQQTPEPVGADESGGQDADAGEVQGASPAPDLQQHQAPSQQPTQAPTATELEQITVTGTRIRGGTSPSPVITIGSEHIREEGFSDLGEVIRSVPQNSAGGQNPGVATGATSGAGGIANQNITGGSALNLRGLGPDATLTLLNGRRLSYSGFSQAVDISAIPVEAVDRIEIVTDGASAIYGSDAVGGVGNIILKREFDGVSVGMRHGAATGGGLATREYSATAGHAWQTGGLIATVKDVSTDPIHAAERGYTAFLRDPTTIHPGSDLRSALLSASQSIGEAGEVRVDMLRTRRDQLYYYYFPGDPGVYNRIAPKTTSSVASATLDLFAGDDWTLSAGATWGKDEHLQSHTRVQADTGESQPYIQACWGCNTTRAYDIGAEGPLFALPGGDARLAAGIGYRENVYRQLDHLAGTVTVDGREGSRYAYAEAELPLVGPETGLRGVRRLTATAAVRSEDYDSFGSVTTPKLGLVYAPGADVTLKASWGRSFKAPTLYQRFYVAQASLDPAYVYGGSVGDTVIVMGGGNPDLGPERATTWSATLALHPRSMDTLDAQLTVFDVDYTERVVQPITDYFTALTNPDYAQFIHYSPTEDEQAAVIARYPNFMNYSGAPYDPARVVALMYANYVNVARQRIRGIDLSGSFGFDLYGGTATLRASSSWIDSRQQNTPAQDAYDLSGLVYNPARLRARAGAAWSRSGWGASVFANYVSGVENVLDGRTTASFTTLDTTVRYRTSPEQGRPPQWELALSAQNLLDRAPPLHQVGSPTHVPYDSTNYSAVGRFVAVSVSATW